MTTAAWIAYGCCMVAIYLCARIRDEARAAAGLGKVYRDAAERFYDLTREQCQQAVDRRAAMDREMFARLYEFQTTGHIRPERKPS